MLAGWLKKLHDWRLERRRARKFRRRQEWSRGLSVNETFEKIYAENKWGKSRNGARFYSGDGSTAEKSSAYEKFVVDILQSNRDFRTWVDIGCGDFQVASRILKQIGRDVDYVGVDVATNLIAWNEQQNSGDHVSFKVCNAVEEDPPPGDLVTVRQVFQHLSNAEISTILERIKRLYGVAVISESLPVKFVAPNLDISHGIAVRIPLGSGVYIDQPPLSLAVSQYFDSPYSDKEFIRTSRVNFAS